MFNREPSVIRSLLPALLLVGLAAAGPAPCRAADADEGAAGDWLARYADARTVGLGGAFTAVADDPAGALWNPAGLRWLDQNALQLGTVRLFDDTAISGLSFALPASRDLSVGVTMLTLNSGEFERTNELNEVLGDFSENDYAFLFSAARGLSRRLAVGASFKVVHHGIEDFGATGVGADLGAQYQATGALRLGASILNVGGPSLTFREREESFPGELRAGAALSLFGDAGLISTEIAHRDGPGTTLRAGTEVWLMSLVALRLGYYDENVSGGFGVRFAHGWRLDYGASDHELGTVHRFGLTYALGGFHAASQATPEIFSPTGANPVTRFELTARTRAEAESWQLMIIDRSGTAVRVFGGQGAPPAQVLWDGKDVSGLPLPDGLYRYRLTVRDAEGHEVIGPQRTVTISTGGPEIMVPVEVN